MPHPGPISYGGSYEQFSFPTVTREDERKQFDATPTLLQERTNQSINPHSLQHLEYHRRGTSVYCPIRELFWRGKLVSSRAFDGNEETSEPQPRITGLAGEIASTNSGSTQPSWSTTIVLFRAWTCSAELYSSFCLFRRVFVHSSTTTENTR